MVAGQSVQLGDDQGSPMDPASCQGLVQFGPVVVPATLSFDELHHRRTAITKERLDSRLLSFKAQPTALLSVGGDPVVGNVLGHDVALIER